MTGDAGAVGEARPVRDDAEGPGARLRRFREQRGLTLEEVAVRLHLDLQVVEALEADRHHALPAPVFVRGYLRQYARLLDLDPQPLLDAYRPPAEDARAAPAAGGLRRPRLRLPRPRLPWRALFLVFLLAVLGWAGLRFGPELLDWWAARTESTSDGDAAAGEATLPLPPP